jgi:hypothetical protein
LPGQSTFLNGRLASTNRMRLRPATEAEERPHLQLRLGGARQRAGASADVVCVDHDDGMRGYDAAAHWVNQTEMSTLPACGIGGLTMPRARSMEASRRALDRCRNARLYLRLSATAGGRWTSPMTLNQACGPNTTVALSAPASWIASVPATPI